MDVESLAKELILKNMTPEQQMAVLDSVRQSVANAKEVQKKKIGENVDLVVQALKKIESDIRDRFDAVGNSIEKRVSSIQDGRDGSNGKDGRDGKDGKSGRDGLKGDRGVDGQAGRDGIDGIDGISVVNANIDFDGSLVITLSDGRELNVGEVVSADIAEKIKVISTMSTNGAVAVKEEGTTITSGVKSFNFVGTGITATTSGDDVTVTVGSGSGTVTSVAALTLGTSGTDLSSTVANSTTTPVITLNVPTASATNRGALSSTDWTTFNNKGSGTVTSVTGTSPVVSSGGATPAISLAANYGDTQNPYASKTLKFVLAAPNGADGVPTFRALVASDIPTLNQSTTGSAATLTTPRAIYGNNFDGSAALTQIIASTYGGTGNGFTKFTGATTAERTYTLPDASSTIVVQGGALGTPSSGTLTNCTFPTLNQNTTGSAASLSATLVATSGGTGQSSYAIGDLLYASTTTALSKLADVATGNALISGGVSVAPSWGKIALTTHVSGTLPVANGGTGLTSIPHTVQVFTSSSGTYTTPANCKAISVRMVGGGGGGAGTGSSATAGTAGGSTTFGTAFLTCTGGAGGFITGTNQAGGTATGGDINIAGATAPGAVGGVTNFTGGVGGSTPFGGAGAGGCANATGSTAATNSGAGGGGGGGGTSTLTGGGGAAGAYLEKLISSPSATYAYAIGAAGTNGTGGTSNGGGGGSGLIIVTEYYV
jgi:hypothetical protein